MKNFILDEVSNKIYVGDIDDNLPEYSWITTESPLGKLLLKDKEAYKQYIEIIKIHEKRI